MLEGWEMTNDEETNINLLTQLNLFSKHLNDNYYYTETEVIYNIGYFLNTMRDFILLTEDIIRLNDIDMSEWEKLP